MVEPHGYELNPEGGAVRAALLRIPPPLVYVAAFLIGVGIEAVMPTPRASAEFERARQLMGGSILALGALLGPANALMFLLRGTTLNPVASPKRLFTRGLYRVSRNPMYLGLLLIYAGIAVLRWDLWALLLIVIPFFVVDRIYIPAEEQRMAAAFGEAYDRYRQRVRRWLGTRPQFGQ